MRKIHFIGIAITCLFIAQSFASGSYYSPNDTYIGNNIVVLSDDLINMPQWMTDRANESLALATYDTEKTTTRYTVVDMAWDRRRNLTTLVVDMEGTILAGFEGTFRDSQMINSSTLMITDWDTNIIFWNLVNNNTEYFPIPESNPAHHDYEYNPITKTFMLFGYEYNGTVNIGGESYTIMQDTLTEIDKEGNILWHWRTYEGIPFDQEFYYLNNITYRGRADWTHGNTVFWDFEEDVLYFNSRTLHTFFKIDKQTKEVLWHCGAFKNNFTHYDRFGNVKDSLFYGQHDIQLLGEDHFLVFNNGWNNQTDLETQTSHFTEFVIDETNWTATEIWSWTAPNDTHYNYHMGGIGRLPDGNTIGAFGGTGGDPTYVTEVTPEGEIVWELNLTGTGADRTEEFYEAPLIKIAQTTFNLAQNNHNITFSVWNSYRNRLPVTGYVRILDNNTILAEQEIEFKNHWQETIINFDLSSLPAGKRNFTLQLENNDGLITSISIIIDMKNTLLIGLGVGIPLIAAGGIITPIMVLIIKKKS